jgi:hypothetical protein
MLEITIEQAQFRRVDHGQPTLVARSPGFSDDWLPALDRLIVGFGIRPPGLACPGVVFAQPLRLGHVAVVQVADAADGRSLGFHALICQRIDYERFLGDPFALADRYPADWHNKELATLHLPRQPLPPRTVAQVQAVLRRVKAGALKENDDPEHPDFERTPENSESPALLGGVQVLVDGGKLVFERSRPDPELVAGLWTLLPQSTRARLWPAGFAFGNALGFDVAVVPRAHVAEFEGYTSEEQAAEYPAGHYEMALQVAAETGNQRDLDQLLNRRSGQETFKLGWTLLVVIILLVLAPGLLKLWQPTPAALDPKFKAAAAAGMVGSGDPWTALGIRVFAHEIWGARTSDGHD